MRVLVEGSRGHQTGGQVDRRPSVPRRERPQRAFSEHGLTEPREPATLAEEPCSEPGAGLDLDALEQLPAETGKFDGLERRPRHQHLDVKKRPLRESKPHDAPAPDRVRAAQEPSEFGEVPAQSARGVLGVREQEVDQLLPGRRPVGERQIREQRPRLPALGRSVTDHHGCAEQVGGDRHAETFSLPLTRCGASVRPADRGGPPTCRPQRSTSSARRCAAM